MKYLPKDVHKLKDEEVAKLLFPKKALEHFKRELAKTSTEKSKKK